jgi:hypothetical protein
VWKKSNELFSKVFNYRPGSGSLAVRRADTAEAGLLFLGIKQGWNSLSNQWMQSPALTILKQTDELLFCHLPKIERSEKMGHTMTAPSWGISVTTGIEVV